jgi:hypothetical protein
MNKPNKPILVTGSHRSGTTWTGKMLGLSKETGYIHEPFNIDLNSGYSKLKLDHWFAYIPPNEEDGLKDEMEYILQFNYRFWNHFLRIRTFKDFLGLGDQYSSFMINRFLGKRPLMKDPIALMSVEWLYKNFDMDVVILIRHPASFVSSLTKLSWQFQFNHFLEQDVLMNTYLYPFRDEIEHFSANEKSTFEQAILLWRIIYHVVNKYRENYPHWIFLRHEDLATNPNEEFKKLYQKVGLNYTTDVEYKIKKSNQSKNPDDVSNPHNVKRSSKSQINVFKKRLTDDEIAYIKEKTGDVWPFFYTNEDWES